MIKLLAASLWDQEFLDEWTLPVGEWAKDIVFWVTTKAESVLNAIAWPFEQLLTRIVDFGIISDSAYDSTPAAIRWVLWPLTFGLREISWLLVVLAFIAIGTISRNFVVGLGAGFALFVCGLLGFSYWDFTVQTIGMIVVAVIICTIIGIPLGIIAARKDQFWNVLRPVLDGMQVIHPFVYLLPVVFFWGIGRTSGTIATMIFALPPIVRLTNLGIRQVPADVVEAARAYGSTEGRVLLDVQIPLARPAIMTGLNQTLLMALSMVGIVAVIAGGGLGQPILRGVNTLNITLSMSSGLALYLVGVVLDRISQPMAGEDRPSLARRIGAIWFRRAGMPGMPYEPAADEATGDDMAVATAGVADDEDGQATPPALAGALTALSGAVLSHSPTERPQTRETSLLSIGFISWSGWPDLNRRPLDPQSSALPGCATARGPDSLPAEFDCQSPSEQPVDRPARHLYEAQYHVHRGQAHHHDEPHRPLQILLGAELVAGFGRDAHSLGANRRWRRRVTIRTGVPVKSYSSRRRFSMKRR